MSDLNDLANADDDEMKQPPLSREQVEQFIRDEPRFQHWMNMHPTDRSILALARTALYWQGVAEGRGELLQELEWHDTVRGDGEAFDMCPWCNGLDFRGHMEGCKLAELLTATPPPAPLPVSPSLGAGN